MGNKAAIRIGVQSQSKGTACQCERCIYDGGSFPSQDGKMPEVSCLFTGFALVPPSACMNFDPKPVRAPLFTFDQAVAA
jgi:hypothetical protein